MIPILYKTVTEGTVPTNYGVGALADVISASVTEERNGAYELSLTYPANGIHAEEIEPNAFIKAKPNYMDDPQLFRIIKVSATIAGKFTVQACHVTYDLSGKIIESGTAVTAIRACELLEDSAGNFIISTDISKVKRFRVTEPASVRSWFGGKTGSLLDLYGGEWHYDNYHAELLKARGADRGVTIRYGKNLTQLSQVLDMSNLCTGIIPYYIDNSGNITVGARVPTGLTLDVSRDVAKDFSQEVDPESSTAISTQLANLANAYISNNELTNITQSITLDFVQLQGITERVDLCDKVNIYFEPLGISAKAKCVKTVWDVLQERYTKTTFGSIRSNIADTIVANSKGVQESASRAYVNESSQLITGNLGGYVILNDSDGDGKPDEILIMNTEDKSTATQVWRFNKGGLGYGTSYSGPFNDIALTADGKINASRIVTGTLTADVIKAGVLSDALGNSEIDMTNGAATMLNFKAKTGLSLVNSNNAVKGEMKIDNSGNTWLNLRAASYNVDLVKLWANDVNGSGVFQLLRSNGKTIVEAGTTGTGGGLGVRNNNDKIVGEFLTTSDSGGYLNLRDSTGTTQSIYMYGSSGAIICVSLTQTSSRKVKENIKPIEDAAKILELEAVSFDYKNKALGTDRRGFIAEEVAEILPNLVKPEEDGQPASLDYLQMVPYLQAVLKEQNERIAALEEKIKKLEG